MSIEAMKQALEALESIRPQNMTPLIHPAKTTLRTAIEEAEKQEPVAYKPPAKWTDAEIKDGYRGIRWVTADGVYGRPTEEDVARYLGYTRPAAQPAPVQEPESFEQWNAKQHGDPEEIGFLQALRIAYCAGQDSVTKTTPPAAPVQESSTSYPMTLTCTRCGAVDKGTLTVPNVQRQWVGLTDEEVQWIYDNGRTPAGMIDMAEAKLREKNSL